jgi:hypothetical protein
MPIEFPCKQCRQTLRIPDDAAGKLSRCPKCGHVGRAPTRTTEHGEHVVSPAGDPLSTDPDAHRDSNTNFGTSRNPFAEGANPFRETAEPTVGWDENPYASPTAPTEHYAGPDGLSELSHQLICDKVAGPAIGLIVLGIANLLLLGIMFVSFVDEGDWSLVGISAVLMATKGGILIAGGVQMKRLRGYGTAMTAAILAVVPCSCCWIAELPIGVWALVVLSDGFVKRAFEQEGWAVTDRGRPFPP